MSDTISSSARIEPEMNRPRGGQPLESANFQEPLKEQVLATKQAVDDAIYSSPGKSVAIAFAAGAGLGAVIGILLSDQRSQTWFDRRVDESLGRRIGSVLSDVLPSQLQRTRD